MKKLTQKQIVIIETVIIVLLLGILIYFTVDIVHAIYKRKNKSKEMVEANTNVQELSNEKIVETGEEIDITELEETKEDESKQNNKNKTNKSNESTQKSNAPKVISGKPYYLRVNYGANVVTVYTQDQEGTYSVPVKAMVCSTGRGTPRSGTYKLGGRWRWIRLLGGVYGQYSTHITGNILFHSVPYYHMDNGSLEWEEYNKLGTAASAGCVRMTVRDVKWIFDNCPAGTTVKIYDGNLPAGVTKPTAQKIDGNSPNKGWDPTDPDPANPWNK